MGREGQRENAHVKGKGRVARKNVEYLRLEMDTSTPEI